MKYLIIVSLVILLSGCTNTGNQVKHTVNEKDKGIVEYTIDTSPYYNVVKGILDVQYGDREHVQEFIETNSAYITETLSNKLLATAQEDDAENDEDEETYEYENFEADDPDFPPEDQIYYPNTSVDKTSYTSDITEEVGYNVSYIEGYYPNKLIASVTHTYSGGMKLVISLIDGKVDDYIIYR